MIYGKQIIRCTLENMAWPRVSVDVIVQNGDTYSLAKPITFEPMTDQNAQYEHTFSLQRDAAQELIDELWRCGLRPSEGTGSAGSLAATERHLADMRTIAFHEIGLLPDNQGKK